MVLAIWSMAADCIAVILEIIGSNSMVGSASISAVVLVMLVSRDGAAGAGDSPAWLVLLGLDIVQKAVYIR